MSSDFLAHDVLTRNARIGQCYVAAKNQLHLTGAVRKGLPRTRERGRVATAGRRSFRMVAATFETHEMPVTVSVTTQSQNSPRTVATLVAPA